MIVIFLITSIVFALLAFFIKIPVISHIIASIYSVILCLFAFYAYNHIGQTESVYFKPDSIGVIFLVVQAIIDVVGTFHYYNYTKSRNDTPKTVAVHNLGRILFNASIAGVLLANHFGILWAFMEATTLTLSLLIYHDRTREALEGTWKYVFICSVGIAIAFAGVLFLSIGATEVGIDNLFFEDIAGKAKSINTFWSKATFLFIVTGFSAKMGLVPLFNVDIDAKDVSPSPVGAKLSSVVMNSGFVAIYRFYNAFSSSAILTWMNHVLIIIGLLSLIFVIAYMLKVKNVKRLMAYSSMEHASLVIITFACGGLGYFAAILHLIIHSLVKSTLFFQFSQIHRIYNHKEYTQMGSYLKINPLGGLVLFLSFISIIGFPPSCMFISELMIFRSIIDSEYWWLAVLVGSGMLFIIYGLSIRIFQILTGKTENQEINITGISKTESLLQLSIIIMVFYLGIVKPDFVIHQIELAVSTLP